MLRSLKRGTSDWARALLYPAFSLGSVLYLVVIFAHNSRSWGAFFLILLLPWSVGLLLLFWSLAVTEFDRAYFIRHVTTGRTKPHLFWRQMLGILLVSAQGVMGYAMVRLLVNLLIMMMGLS
jgi:hypothetical protein